MNTKTKENILDQRQLSTSERSVIEKHLVRSIAETPVPRLKVKEDGTSISVDHPDEAVGWALILERLGNVAEVLLIPATRGVLLPEPSRGDIRTVVIPLLEDHTRQSVDPRVVRDPGHFLA